MFCTSCGKPLGGQAFCTNCGAPAAGPVQDGPPDRLDPEATTAMPPAPAGWAAAPPTGWAAVAPVGSERWYADPVGGAAGPHQSPAASGPPAGSGGSRRRLAILLAATVVAVLTIAGVAFAVLQKRPVSSDATPISVATTGASSAPFSAGSSGSSASANAVTSASTPAGAATAPASVGASSAPGGNLPLSVVTTTLTTDAVTTTAPAVPSSTVSPRPTATTAAKPMTSAKPAAPAALPDPMAKPAQQLACGSGYIVQIASSTDTAELRTHVALLLKNHLLPANAHWTEIGGSCEIWTATSGAVLYAGPFASPYDGCDARLHSPSDSFIKIVDAANFKTYYSCMCAANAAPPTVGPGSKGPWVGEVQRALSGNNFPIPGLEGEAGVPDAWGKYNPDTVAAVKAFQTAKSLPATGTMDPTSWQTLSSSFC